MRLSNPAEIRKKLRLKLLHRRDEMLFQRPQDLVPTGSGGGGSGRLRVVLESGSRAQFQEASPVLG